MLLDSMLFTGAREQYSGVCQFGVGAPKRSLGSMCGMGKSSPGPSESCFTLQVMTNWQTNQVSDLWIPREFSGVCGI